MRRIRRIGVVSVGLIEGVIMAVFGLLMGGFVSLFGMLGSSMAGDTNMGVGSMMFGIGAIVILPIVYGIFGFVGGVITALVYNIAAGFVGGIEIEFEQDHAEPF